MVAITRIVSPSKAESAIHNNSRHHRGRRVRLLITEQSMHMAQNGQNTITMRVTTLIFNNTTAMVAAMLLLAWLSYRTQSFS